MPMDPKIPISKVTDTPDNDPETEAEGHGRRWLATEQPADDPEADGEVEGHGRRWLATEQPADDDDPEAGDTEPL